MKTMNKLKETEIFVFLKVLFSFRKVYIRVTWLSVTLGSSWDAC